MNKFSNFDSEDIEIEKIIPYARNPRKNKSAIVKVAASIAEYGFKQPIVVDSEMVVIVGHARLEAAHALGLQKVPVHVAKNLTPIQAKAYRIADNRTHEEAGWDEELLALELEELQEAGFDLESTAFDTSELDALLTEFSDCNENDIESIPDMPEEPITKTGDIWQLGRHRLVCGDSTNSETYE